MKFAQFALSGVALAGLAFAALAVPTLAKESEMTVEVGGAPMFPS
jgi:hypothetical protein